MCFSRWCNREREESTVDQGVLTRQILAGGVLTGENGAVDSFFSLTKERLNMAVWLAYHYNFVLSV